jgi:microcystin-dependent protein
MDWIQLIGRGTEPSFPGSYGPADKEGTVYYNDGSGLIDAALWVFDATTSAFAKVIPNNNASDIDTGLLSGEFGGVPIGTIIFWAGTATSLVGYLPCNGSSGLSATTYAALYLVIANTWGGTSTVDFTLPDFRGEFIRGANTIGGTTGTTDPDSTRTFGSTQDFKMFAHRHWSGTPGTQAYGAIHPTSTTSHRNGSWSSGGAGHSDYELSSLVSEPTVDRTGYPLNYSTYTTAEVDYDELRPVNVNAQFYIKY